MIRKVNWQGIRRIFSNSKNISQKADFYGIMAKGSSKVKTALNENNIRDTGFKKGLVDVKVCAVDEIGSGLKFVYRSTDRM